MGKGLKWIIAFAGAMVIVLLLRGFAFTSCLIPSAGMENSLFQGERILVNKWSYGLRVPYMSLFSYHRWGESPIHKDDIVVFNNPAGIKEPVIDRREIYISRCIGVPGDTLLIDSLFNVVDRSTQLGPDRKQLYTYPQTKEQQLDSLLSILSIGPNELMGQHEGKNVRSFSRYEYYLLDQAMNGKSWIQPLQQSLQEEAKPLIVPGKEKQSGYIRGTGHCYETRWYCMRVNRRRSETIRSTSKDVLHNIVISPKIITGWLPIIR